MAKRKWREKDHPRDKNHQKFVRKNGGNKSTDNIHLTKTDYRDTINKPTAVMLPKKLYAAFDSIIRTRYANNIPREGYIMCYNPIEGFNDFMRFSYDKEEDRNICTRRLDLDRDKEEIAIILRSFGDE